METVAYNNQTFLSSLVRNPAGLAFKEMIKTLLCTFKQKGPESCFYFKLTKKKNCIVCSRDLSKFAKSTPDLQFVLKRLDVLCLVLALLMSLLRLSLFVCIHCAFMTCRSVIPRRLDYLSLIVCRCSSHSELKNRLLSLRQQVLH